LAAGESEEAWAALVKGGHVALIRHGNAPPGYGGDPPGFKIDDCKTQRNLDEQGRGEARALCEAFRNRGVRVDRILSAPMVSLLGNSPPDGCGPCWGVVGSRSGQRLECPCTPAWIERDRIGLARAGARWCS